MLAPKMVYWIVKEVAAQLAADRLELFSPILGESEKPSKNERRISIESVLLFELGNQWQT
jgi:hypothetical protein